VYMIYPSVYVYMLVCMYIYMYICDTKISLRPRMRCPRHRGVPRPKPSRCRSCTASRRRLLTHASPMPLCIQPAPAAVPGAPPHACAAHVQATLQLLALSVAPPPMPALASTLPASSCSAPAASRSHRLPRARPRTRPHCHHPPACSDCGGASPAARLFSCTSFHAGPRLCPPSCSTSIASRTHRSPCPRPRTRPRSHRPPACGASCGSASAAGSLFSWASLRTGPRLCLPSYPAAIASRFQRPSRACPYPRLLYRHLPLYQRPLPHTAPISPTSLSPVHLPVHTPHRMGQFRGGWCSTSTCSALCACACLDPPRRKSPYSSGLYKTRSDPRPLPQGMPTAIITIITITQLASCLQSQLS
jgi:hypothetical protein